MKRLLLIGMLCPLLSATQEVQPIVSIDYLILIGNDSANAQKNKVIDSTNNINQSKLRNPGHYYGGTLRKISVDINNTLKLEPLYTEHLYIGGFATIGVELRRRNRIPAVQHEYVQGRSVNNALVWRGPETNEIFSYGPAITSLEYDGNSYPYDINGKLVPRGSGNGITAKSYNNSIFRTASLLSHSVALQMKYRKDYQRMISAGIKAGQKRENTFIVGNKNKADNFSASLEGLLKRFSISSSYNYRQERFTHNNRSGFLNRVYQNALLAPVSFDSRQATLISPNQQRSYSETVDNPLFLLDNDQHFFLQQQRSGNLVLGKKIGRGWGSGSIKVSQSFENVEQRSTEGYETGTAFFQNGIALNRNTRDDNYYLQANADYTIPRVVSRDAEILLAANYLYANNKSAISYLSANKNYQYQRSSNDFSLSVTPSLNLYKFFGGITLGNKMYSSNTSINNNFFLPAVSFFARFEEIFNLENVAVKFAGSFSRFNNELPINKSFAANSLLQYTAANSLQNIPVTEVNSFDNLQTIGHREYTAKVELSYGFKASLTMDWFSRNTYRDVFPIWNAGEMQLANIADHRNSGIELELRLHPRLWNSNKLSFHNNISWVKYRSKVIAVNPGYNYTSIAGFSDVHKAIVRGEPLGVIIGNSFLKDAAGTVIIGADGFPLVNTSPSIVGNPVPDFVMKMNHRVNWKKWDLIIDWEWEKGGDVWNGTAALLDYYGRSASSALLRNTSNYVFNGVQLNGSHNNIPVSFYDPAKPFEQNRWVRYGPVGVAEEYIQKGDCLRLNNVSVSYKPDIKKYLQQLSFTLSANNVLLWSAYKGADASQLLNDQAGTTGLDFFNLPSFQSFGFTVSPQF